MVRQRICVTTKEKLDNDSTVKVGKSMPGVLDIS